jgi:amino acid adenylation domain-containing protein
MINVANVLPVTGTHWGELAATVLGLPPDVVAERAETRSFTELGGTSLLAIEYVARLAEEQSRSADIAALLGPQPLAVAAPGTPSAPRRQVPEPAAKRDGPISRSQQGMLLGEELWGADPSPNHLLFSATITGALDAARLKSALARVTGRHDALRTVFTRDPATGALGRRVIPGWEPVIIEQELPPPPPGTEPADVVHALLAPSAPRLLRPYDQPPVVFVVTSTGNDRVVLSILVHHVVADGWSIGLLWEQIAAEYGGTGGGDPSVDDIIELEQAATARGSAADRAAALEGWPQVVELPSDLERPQTRSPAGCRLPFSLSAAARAGCAELAEAAGVTRNSVLLAAWALVIARRAGVTRLIMGLPSAGRVTAASRQVVGCYVKLLPVPCEILDDETVIGYVRQTARRLHEALAYGDVPVEDIVTALGASSSPSRTPLAQVGFAAHDELVPAAVTAGDLTFAISEGHCGGTPLEAMLYVQRWDPVPVLALECATSVLAPDEAASLASGLEHTLAEMAAARHGPLADVRTVTASQHRQLIAAGAETPADTSMGLWDLIEATAARHPEAIAVRDTDPSRTLTYGQLIAAAQAQSARLAAAGVSEGDCVAISVRRGIAEVVAVLAVLRLGAAYTGLDPVLPPAVAGAMLDRAGVRVITGDPGRLAVLGDARAGRQTVPIIDPSAAACAGTGGADAAGVPPAAPPDPERTAYVGFTSGSTGAPKGTMVPCRGVLRLALDPVFLRPGACARFMRVSPLAFDLSTLEIFAPLLAGGTIEVLPGAQVTPDALAEFLRGRAVTGVWLTSGLFRLVADYRPDAFRGVIQLLAGGDVVPPQQVAKVLRACPGLRVTNGYGPTENTTFTTVFHVDDPVAAAAGSVPIGRPIPGTGVLVLDHAGRLVPPGGVGELCTYGVGLATGYLGQPAETAKVFGRFSPGIDQVLYRTGDLARWDRTWNLRFLGRRDRQLKIRGFRVELDSVTTVLREYPGVRDAAAAATSIGNGGRQILAAIAAPPDPELPAALRSFAAERLPGYAVPALWAIVEEFPLTTNGKLDVRRLTEIATDQDAGSEAAEAPGGGDPIEQALAQAWQEALGHRGFGRHDRFLDVGGNSLLLLHVHAILGRTLPRYRVTMADLYRHQVIADLAAALRTRAGAELFPQRIPE